MDDAAADGFRFLEVESLALAHAEGRKSRRLAADAGLGFIGPFATPPRPVEVLADCALRLRLALSRSERQHVAQIALHAEQQIALHEEQRLQLVQSLDRSALDLAHVEALLLDVQSTFAGFRLMTSTHYENMAVLTRARQQNADALARELATARVQIKALRSRLRRAQRKTRAARDAQ